MAGRFTQTNQVGISARTRTYKNTPAGHLEAARDKTNDMARLRGHELQHWSKDTRARPPYFTARCTSCGGTVLVATGRAPRPDPGFRGRPKMIRFGRITWCPGKTGRWS